MWPKSMVGEINVQAFLLEYDTEWAGGFASLRALAEAQAGRARLGDHEVVAARGSRRVENAHRRGPGVQAPDNLTVSRKCGSSSIIGGNPVTVDDQRRKPELVVRIAHHVRGSA